MHYESYPYSAISYMKVKCLCVALLPAFYFPLNDIGKGFKKF